jgi:hypothetical protein
MEKKKNVSGSIQATSDIHNGIVAEDEFQRVANKVSFVTIIGNILLSVMKLIAGFIAHSNAMISDAIHSASDVFSTFVVIIGIKLASKKADKEHPYGHERLECVAAIVLSMVLFITGFGIGAAALKNITSGDYNNIVVPGVLALMTGTKVDIRVVSAYADFLSVPAMDMVMEDSIIDSPLVEYTDEEYKYASQFNSKEYDLKDNIDAYQVRQSVHQIKTA